MHKNIAVVSRWHKINGPRVDGILLLTRVDVAKVYRTSYFRMENLNSIGAK